MFPWNEKLKHAVQLCVLAWVSMDEQAYLSCPCAGSGAVTFSQWPDSVQGLKEMFDHLSLPLTVDYAAQSSWGCLSVMFLHFWQLVKPYGVRQKQVELCFLLTCLSETTSKNKCFVNLYISLLICFTFIEVLASVWVFLSHFQVSHIIVVCSTDGVSSYIWMSY